MLEEVLDNSRRPDLVWRSAVATKREFMRSMGLADCLHFTGHGLPPGALGTGATGAVSEKGCVGGGVALEHDAESESRDLGRLRLFEAEELEVSLHAAALDCAHS